jgi:hypothetical protein
MSRNEKDEMIVKYTLMPFNDDEDYEHFFSLSLRELAKNTKDKSLLAPLIVYNSDLDVPMDNDLEEYTVYCNKSQILEVIKKQEVNDVFRTLILHGFEIDLDEMKDTYIGIARRNQADLCINVIEDTGIDSNITLYIDSSIEKSDDKLWAIQRKEMEDEIESFIENYDASDYELYEYSSEDIENVETFLETLFGDWSGFTPSKPKKKENKKEDKKEDKSNKIITLPAKANSFVSSSDLKDDKEDLKIDEDVIGFSFENNGDVVKVSCIDKDLILIEENDYEVALNLTQMEFVMDCYKRIKDYLDGKEPRF